MLFDFLRLLNIVFFLICDHFVLELVRRTKTPDPSYLILQLLDLVHIVDHALCLLPPHLEERLVLVFSHLLNRLLVLPLQPQKSLLQLCLRVPSSWSQVGLLWQQIGACLPRGLSSLLCVSPRVSSLLLEDIILARSRTKDAKTKEKRAELASKEAEILRGELDPEVAVFSEAGGKEVEQHPTFKLIPHQARVGPGLASWRGVKMSHRGSFFHRTYLKTLGR